MSRALRCGRVLDAAGNGVTGARVSVVWGTAPTPEIGRRTGDDGAFQVGLPPGLFRLQAVTDSGSTGEVEVEGGEGRDILIRIEASPGRGG
ncbi:MAG: carboxypeptidase regulatory-like domain-containing protein [Lamprocystis purpurea]|uniref:carboxypeptidase-like regulatory domain-containing protein n=1 Tax=Lamprocystis purpurea TaxID=61598 RepID=UPI0003772196|nr:carboxypeptidase-like regulatory domain-containing protein [Lamprocystis purpurea]MBV5275728.1 carboxypeptidase regulatory-like domain-containing protein [Lamprocystis purpurea]